MAIHARSPFQKKATFARGYSAQIIHLEEVNDLVEDIRTLIRSYAALEEKTKQLREDVYSCMVCQLKY